MRIEILSHASMLITHKDTSIIIDPWLIGSAYWRSWWNYPKSCFDEIKIKEVDAVIISHIHWDHWHGPTLKKFFKDKHFIIPDEPGVRSENDLRGIGISNITRLKNGETLVINGISIRLYQFGLYLNDSAIIIDCDSVKILNANDSKIAGASLQSLLSKEGAIDFAFRSHSSANARACYKISGTDESFDDNEHYLRSFKLFMDKVRPKFAVPFASNHCHLHDETFEFNKIISNPYVLDNFLKDYVIDWSFQIMLPGSSWDDVSGFRHLYSEDIFHNLPLKLNEYKEEVSNLLHEQKVREERVIIDFRIFKNYIEMLPNLRKVPKIFQRSFYLKLTFPIKEPLFYVVEMSSGEYKIQQVDLKIKLDGPLVIFPAIIFRDAVLKNMFHHAAISKRCKFIGRNLEDIKLLSYWQNILEKNELIGSNVLCKEYLYRSFNAYSKRLPEFLVYCKAYVLLKVFKLPIYQVEELILSGKWFGKRKLKYSLIER
jgi:UDP-MurNAc hydroxylase